MNNWLTFSLALIVVVAGAVWAMIWLLSFVREARGADWSMLRKLPAAVTAAWLVTGVYCIIYYIVAMIIGGTPVTRISPNSSYSLEWSGKTVEVSRETYNKSRAAEAIQVLLIMGSVAISLKLLPKNSAETKNSA